MTDTDTKPSSLARHSVEAALTPEVAISVLVRQLRQEASCAASLDRIYAESAASARASFAALRSELASLKEELSESQGKASSLKEEVAAAQDTPLQILSTTVTNSVRRRTFRNLRTKDLVVRERPVAPQNPNKVPMPVGDEFTAVTQRQAEELWNGENHAPMTRLLVAAVVARKESP